ncbi:MAG: NAD(P)-dependent oxidoreductase [Pseudomonadota bacterium]
MNALNASPVGFIGLGNMGSGMARCLLDAGVPLHIFDCDLKRCETFSDSTAVVCNTPADLVRHCDLIFLCLPYAPEVRDVLFGPEAIANENNRGKRIIDCTTLDHRDALTIAEQLSSLDIDYSDAPVSGLVQRAHDGTLTVMFGGSASAFEVAKPYLDCFGSKVLHCGSVGSGQAMKAFNNILYNINIAGLCEVLPLAVATGLDPQTLANVVTSGSSSSFASQHFVPKILAREFSGDYPMAKAYKDIENVAGIVADFDTPTPMIDAMKSVYNSAMENGYGNEPKSAMIKVFEKSLGVTLSNEPTSN